MTGPGFLRSRSGESSAKTMGCGRCFVVRNLHPAGTKHKAGEQREEVRQWQHICHIYVQIMSVGQAIICAAYRLYGVRERDGGGRDEMGFIISRCWRATQCDGWMLQALVLVCSIGYQAYH